MSRNVILRSVLGISVVACLGALAWVGVRLARGQTDPELCAALQQHRLTVVQRADGATLSCPGITTRGLSEGVDQSLKGRDGTALREQLLREKGNALAIPIQKGVASGPALIDQLSHFGRVAGISAIAFTPALAIYAPLREQEPSARERDALAYVARALLRGAREPNLSSFPPALRRVERVEIMVMLREHGEPRLWRSARGTSIARALLTATRVARDRWHERESAMGGPLSRRLLDLDVEITRLTEDGVLLGTDQRFIDRATGAEHGIGFEYRSSWHYVLPEDMKRRGSGSAFRALTALLGEQNLSAGVLLESAFRAYRFVALTLGVSTAPLAGADSPG